MKLWMRGEEGLSGKVEGLYIYLVQEDEMGNSPFVS
jgi:hypothetical protein